MEKETINNSFDDTIKIIKNNNNKNKLKLK
jgi:hypothetical protein